MDEASVNQVFPWCLPKKVLMRICLVVKLKKKKKIYKLCSLNEGSRGQDTERMQFKTFIEE